jgi:hypothetical protein
MFDPQIEFVYASRRAREEEVAAINASGEAAATAHRKLSRLYSARALLALLDPDQALLGSAIASAPAAVPPAGSGMASVGLC